jgi:hypothetical protein
MQLSIAGTTERQTQTHRDGTTERQTQTHRDRDREPGERVNERERERLRESEKLRLQAPVLKQKNDIMNGER